MCAFCKSMVRKAHRQPEYNREDSILKVGYYSMLQARYPLNEDPQNTSSPEDAYFLSLERNHCSVPEDLSFQALEDKIHPEERGRIQKIWDKLVELKEEVDDYTESLNAKWTRGVPQLQRPNSKTNRWLKELVTSETGGIQRQYRRAVMTSLGENPKGKGRPSARKHSRIKLWRNEEKGLRESFYRANKNYLTCLRLYYAMLVEESPDGEKSTIQEADPALKTRISIELRYVEVIDACVHGLAAAKAAHHEQPKGKIRKTKETPYISHILGVDQAMLLDVIPFVIEEDKLPLDVVLYAAALSMHDAVEDTDLAVEDAVAFLRRIVDNYDSSIDQSIVSIDPVQRPRSEVKKRVLNLMGKNNQINAKRILRIISNNTKLSDVEKKKGLQRNIAGKEATLTTLELEEHAYKAWGVETDGLPEALKTFRTYPQDYDGGKMTRLLHRMHAITRTPSLQQAVLIWKLEDRAHNLGELEGMKLAKKLSNLRGSTTRLLAYCMLDHNQESSPLYNALPRCIDVTLKQYLRLQSEHPEALEEHDLENIQTLTKWQDKVKRWELPNHIQETIAEYHAVAA